MPALFRRRRGSLHPDHLREVVSPRKGVLRGLKYLLLRLRRMKDTPHRIALGFSFGVFASCTPLFGLHIVIGMGLAWIFRVPVTAAIVGTAAGNPLTFPLVATLSIGWGRWILGILGIQNPQSIQSLMNELFLPWLAGGIPLGILAGGLAYGGLRLMVTAWRKWRSRKKKSGFPKTPKTPKTEMVLA